MYNRNEWLGFVIGNPGDELLTLTRCHSCRLPQLYEALEGWKSLRPSLQLKGHERGMFFVSFFLMAYKDGTLLIDGAIGKFASKIVFFNGVQKPIKVYLRFSQILRIFVV